MYPRSGFRSGGTSERTLVPVCRSGGTSAKTTLLETILLGSSNQQTRSPPASQFTVCTSRLRALEIPKGPKIEKIQDRPPGLKFSSEIENIKQATHQTPFFCGQFWRSGLKISSEIEIFNRDWKFQSRRAILNFFNLWALRDPLLWGCTL